MLNDVQNETFAEQLREKTRYYREKEKPLDFFLVCDPEWLDKQHPEAAKKVQRPCIALVGAEESWLRCVGTHEFACGMKCPSKLIFLMSCPSVWVLSCIKSGSQAQPLVAPQHIHQSKEQKLAGFKLHPESCLCWLLHPKQINVGNELWFCAFYMAGVQIGLHVFCQKGDILDC
jgi:hypothetical protein